MTTTLKSLSLIKPATMLVVVCVLALGPTRAVAQDLTLLVIGEFNDKVLRYDGQTGDFIGDLMPAGTGGLNAPTGLNRDADGNIYVSSNATDRVLRYNG